MGRNAEKKDPCSYNLSEKNYLWKSCSLRESYFILMSDCFPFHIFFAFSYLIIIDNFTLPSPCLIISSFLVDFSRHVDILSPICYLLTFLYSQVCHRNLYLLDASHSFSRSVLSNFCFSLNLSLLFPCHIFSVNPNHCLACSFYYFLFEFSQYISVTSPVIWMISLWKSSTFDYLSFCPTKKLNMRMLMWL